MDRGCEIMRYNTPAQWKIPDEPKELTDMEKEMLYYYQYIPKEYRDRVVHIFEVLARFPKMKLSDSKAEILEKKQ